MPPYISKIQIAPPLAVLSGFSPACDLPLKLSYSGFKGDYGAGYMPSNVLCLYVAYITSTYVRASSGWRCDYIIYQATDHNIAWVLCPDHGSSVNIVSTDQP